MGDGSETARQAAVYEALNCSAGDTVTPSGMTVLINDAIDAYERSMVPYRAFGPELLAELRHVLSAYVLPERKTCGEAAADGERIKALIAKATGGGA